MFLLTSPLPSHVPPEIRRAAGVDCGRRFRGNCSGADVFRLDPPGGPARFLKVMLAPPDRPAASLAGERDRVTWAAKRLAISGLRSPKAAAYGERACDVGLWSYLLTDAVEGQPLHEAMGDGPIRAGRLMGRALRALHALDASGCPGWATPDDLLARAERNVRDGNASSQFLRTRDPAAARRLLKRLATRPPTAFDPVVCHGDYCLPNVLAGLDDACGLVDLGSLAVADRHLDLAAAVRSLRHNGGRDDVVRVFLNWYGPDRVDEARLRWYGDLCELV